MVNADRARSRTFVVTGAASGIGLATAERLLAEGGVVVGADVAAPPDLGPDFHFVAADITDESAVAAVLAAVPDRLDGIVHAAGVAGGGPVHLLDLAEWERVIAINLTGTFLVAKAALARMIEQPRVDGERGSIVTFGQRGRVGGYRGRQRVQRGEGWRRIAHQEHRAGLRAQRHPGQRRLSRFHRNTFNRKRIRDARDGGPPSLDHARARATTDGPVRGSRRDGGIPGVARRVVHQRPSHRR
jgi:PAS domain-containing protein